MDARVAMWELRQGERECESVMKGKGRTRCRRQGGADQIEWFARRCEGRVRGGQRGKVQWSRCQVVPLGAMTVSLLQYIVPWITILPRLR